jgi:hypothetical protein
VGQPAASSQQSQIPQMALPSSGTMLYKKFFKYEEVILGLLLAIILVYLISYSISTSIAMIIFPSFRPSEYCNDVTGCYSRT